MDLDVEYIADIAIVTYPRNILDAQNSDEFKKAIRTILEANKKVVLDLGKVTFMDSTGLGAILSCLTKLNRKDGALRLCGLTKNVRALFEIVRMHWIFDINETRAESVITLKES
jgi:anti-sigma B factor antagonist